MQAYFVATLRNPLVSTTYIREKLVEEGGWRCAGNRRSLDVKFSCPHLAFSTSSDCDGLDGLGADW